MSIPFWDWLSAKCDFYAGRRLVRLGDYSRAELRLRRAVEKLPSDINARAFHAWSLAQLERYVDALAQYDIAVSLRPDVGYARYGRGRCLFNLGRLNEALDELERARRISPRLNADREFLSFLAFTYFSTNSYQKALETYRNTLRQFPRDLLTLVNEGKLLDFLGEHAQAESSFRQALAIDPQEAEAIDGLGGSLGRQERWKESAAEFEKLVAISKADSDVFCRLGSAYRISGRLQEAQERLESAVQMDPTNADAFQQLAVLHADTEDWQASLKAARELIRLRPDEEVGYWSESSALAELGRYDEAIESSLVALRINPASVPALGGLAYSYINKGQYHEAIEVGQQALRHDPNHLPTIECLSYAYAQLKRFDEAISILKHGLNVDPRDHRLRFNLINAYLDSGDRSSAEQELLRLRDLDTTLANKAKELFEAP
jgi:tetratricopeptide (TPR) repeat protein